jgi:hypothetical protein
MVSASCPPPCALLAFDLAPEPPAAAELSLFFSVEADAPALPDALSDFSVLVLALPLADGVLLPLAEGVLVLPDALLPVWLLWDSLLGFSWLIDGLWPVCDSCFLSCATLPNDNNAAATATAMGLNLIKLLSLDTDR